MRRNRLYIHFWEQAPMFRLLLPLTAGIVLYDRSSYRLSFPVLITILVISCALLACAYLSVLRNPRHKIPYFLSAMLFLTCIGYTLYFQYDQRNDPDWYGKYKGHYVQQLAVVAAAPVQQQGRTKLELHILAGTDQRGHNTALRGKVLLYLYHNGDTTIIEQGDTLVVPAAWQDIRNGGNPFEFDYAAWCRRRNIFQRQFADRSAIVLAAKHQPGAASFLTRSHQYCISSIEKYARNPAVSALLKAVITGDESGIDPELRQAYSDTGIIHIISVSGAHVNLLFISIAFLLRFISSHRYRWIPFVLSFLLIWFYVLMAGAAAPAIRAALMFSIVSGGIMLYRQAAPLNQLCAAGFIMLLYQPPWLFAAGFQLSFLAILSIILFYAPVRELLQPRNKILAWLWQSLALSLAAELLVAPLVAYYFHNFPLTFLAANIIACLAMSAILVLGILLVLIAPIPAAAAFLAVLLTHITVVFHSCILWLQRLSPSAMQYIQLSTPGMLLLYGCIGAGAVLLIGRRKRAVWPALGCLLLFGLLSLEKAHSTIRQKLFIVYSSKGCQADLLLGDRHLLISGDSTADMTRKTVYTGFRCYHNAGFETSPVLQAGRDRILLLDQAFPAGISFPVDIVVLRQYDPQLQIDLVRSSLHPRLLVISGGLNKWQADKIKQACAALQLACHNTREDGAFILQLQDN